MKRTKRVTDVDTHIGNRIRAARIAADVTQIELADACGLTFQQIQKYEKGVNRVAVARLITIAAALDRPYTYFIPADDHGRQPDRCIEEFLAAKGGQDLARAFMAINNQHLRSAIVGIVERIVDQNVEGKINAV